MPSTEEEFRDEYERLQAHLAFAKAINDISSYVRNSQRIYELDREYRMWKGDPKATLSKK